MKMNKILNHRPMWLSEKICFFSPSLLSKDNFPLHVHSVFQVLHLKPFSVFTAYIWTAEKRGLLLVSFIQFELKQTRLRIWTRMWTAFGLVIFDNHGKERKRERKRQKTKTVLTIYFINNYTQRNLSKNIT